MVDQEEPLEIGQEHVAIVIVPMTTEDGEEGAQFQVFDNSTKEHIHLKNLAITLTYLISQKQDLLLEVFEELNNMDDEELKKVFLAMSTWASNIQGSA